MMYRILPLSAVLMLLSTAALAQKPTPALYGPLLASPESSRAACNNAGTVNISIPGGSQTYNPQFLCFGDSLTITHNGDFDLSGDPNPATPAGIGYGFYACPPSIGGMTLAEVLTDPCILDTPPPPTGLWITGGSTPNGNMTFVNDGFLQGFFNGGAPVQIWFAPITIDNFASNTYEEASPGAGAGPCVDVNINAAFPVVYLNPIRISMLTSSAYGVAPGTGSFVITGGKSEFDGSNYSISIYQRTNPNILATITSGAAAHGSTVTFTVPNDREYVVEIEDGTGCAATFFVTVPSVVLEMHCTEVEEGATGCIQVRARNYTQVESIQLFFHYDPAVATFSSLTAPGIPGFIPAVSSTVIGDSILGISHVAFPGNTVPNGEVLFSICFTAVGKIGDCMPVILKNRFDGAKNEAIIGLGGGNDAQIAISSLAGCFCIVESGDVKVTTTPTPISCNGKDDGAIKIDVQGGTPPYTFQWAHATNPTYQGSGVLAFNPSTITLPNLIPGIYSITITDSEGVPNVVTRQVLLANPAPVAIFLEGKAPTCFGDTDGFLIADVLNGQGALLYNWSTGQSGIDLDIIDGLGSGTYQLTVTDSKGCSQVASTSLTTTALSITATNVQQVTCSGGANSGSITVQAQGGTITPGGSYVYSWSSGANGPNLTNLGPGNYTVTVSDNNGCQAVLSIPITAPEAPTIDALIATEAGCVDKANGAILAQVTPAPGGGTLSYAWTGPGGSTYSGAQINGLLPGNYFLTVTDNNGCSATGVTFVDFRFPFAIVDTFKTIPSCPGLANGSLGLQVIGGTTPYSFTWSNLGSSSPNSVNPAIPAGSYSVTVTDAEGCGPTVLTLTLEDPAAIVVSLSDIDSVSCHTGICDGQATATAGYSDGSTGLFTYQWASGQTSVLVPSSTAGQLCSGLQSLIVSDGSCALDTLINMPSPGPIVVEAEVTPIRCFGENNGAIQIVSNGGVQPYLYIWAAGDTTSTAQRGNLGTGTYQITVADQNGCLGISPAFNLPEPDRFELTLDTVRTFNVRCAGELNGTVAVQAAGGNPGPIQYQWIGSGSQTTVATSLGAGIYRVTATDSKGCADSLTHVLVAPPAIQWIFPAVEEPLCHGESTLVTIDTASGGNGPAFTFSVDGSIPQALGTSVPVFAGSGIQVSVFDAAGCRRDTLININQPAPLVLDLGPDLELELGDSLTIGPLTNPGATIISYLWNPREGISGCDFCERVTVSPRRNTTYRLRIEDENGCAAEDQITITVRTIRRVYIPSAFSPNFDGFNDLFTVHTGKGVELVAGIDIYDRWGNHLYSLQDQRPPADGTVQGWDGHYRGKIMDPGTYVYVVRVRFQDGQELIYRGDINLVR